MKKLSIIKNGDCWLVKIDITDPRTQKPLVVKMDSNGGFYGFSKSQIQGFDPNAPKPKFWITSDTKEYTHPTGNWDFLHKCQFKTKTLIVCENK